MVSVVVHGSGSGTSEHGGGSDDMVAMGAVSWAKGVPAILTMNGTADEYQSRQRLRL